jgi:outer membrane protein assembly factor BamB
MHCPAAPARALSLALAALSALVAHGPAAGIAQGADWPRWRGPANDGHAPAGTPALTSLPAEPSVVWEIPAGEGLASPVVAGGRVLAFDNQDDKETLRLLDASNGRELWRAPVDEPFTDSQGPRGPRNTPLLDGDRAYAVSCRGELQCRKTSDGSLVWRANFTKDFGAVFVGESGSAPGATRHGNDGSPLVDGEHLIVNVGSTNGAGTVCFDKRDGRVMWKSTRDIAAYAPPVVASVLGETQVIVYNAAGVVGLRRSDGLELWRVPVKTAFARHVTTPIVRSNTVVVSSHQAGHLGIRITREGGQWNATNAWTARDSVINYASPVAVEDHLYGVGPAKNVVCVEIETGRLRWAKTGVFQTSPDKTYGGFLAVGKNVLTLTDSGEAVLFEAEPETYRELGRAQVCGVNWCNPAFADGVLYLRDGLKKDGHWKAVRLQATAR